MIEAVLICGTVITIAGWYGPEDGGVLGAIGLVLIGIAVWQGVFA